MRDPALAGPSDPHHQHRRVPILRHEDHLSKKVLTVSCRVLNAHGPAALIDVEQGWFGGCSES